MAGLKDKRGFIDKERLDLSERKAVEYWMKRWGVTRDQLTAAHRKVGRLTKDIAAAEYAERVLAEHLSAAYVLVCEAERQVAERHRTAVA